MTTRELVEILADAEHASWSHWMKYLFTQGTLNPDGSYTIPPELVDRWTIQMHTPYADLANREQESDRNEVYKILPHIVDFVIEANRPQTSWVTGEPAFIGVDSEDDNVDDDSSPYDDVANQIVELVGRSTSPMTFEQIDGLIDVDRWHVESGLQRALETHRLNSVDVNGERFYLPQTT